MSFTYRSTGDVAMATVNLQLKGYKVVTGIPMFKPFGHLYIEYWLEDKEEATRIFRGGPDGIFLRVQDTLESESKDKYRRIADKGIICIAEKRRKLIANEDQVNNGKLAFNNLVEMLINLTVNINTYKSIYGAVFNNSNSIAYEMWKLLTGGDPYIDIDRSKYRFVGSKYLAIRKLLRARFNHSLLE